MDSQTIACFVEKGILTQEQADAILPFINVGVIPVFDIGGSEVTAIVEMESVTAAPGVVTPEALSVQGQDGGIPVAGSGLVVNPTDSFGRPGDTTPYQLGDLVTGSTPEALEFNPRRVAGASVMIRGARLVSSSTSLTNASYRVHLFAASSAALNVADNAPITGLSVSPSNHIGYIDIIMQVQLNSGTLGYGAVSVRPDINISKYNSGISFTDTIYAFLEARAARTPGAGEIFTLSLDIIQN